MENDISEEKMKLLKEIESKVPVFKRRSKYQFSIRCPFCGDSQSDLRDSHLYLKCSPDPTEPILYNCFKCPASGRVNNAFLAKLGVNGSKFQLGSQYYNKLMSAKSAGVEILTGEPKIESDQVGYLEFRLGSGFTVDDYSKFKIVWNMNKISPHISSQSVRNTLPCNSDSVSFISDNRSMLLTRFFNPTDEASRWKKIKLFQDDSRSFYTIRCSVNVFEPITVNIAEGVFDILSVYKNFKSQENSAYIACLGDDYSSAVDYAIAKGMVGGNVSVRVYVDNDINRSELKLKLKKYKWLFDTVTLLWNTKENEKDFGVHVEKIKIAEVKI